MKTAGCNVGMMLKVRQCVEVLITLKSLQEGEYQSEAGRRLVSRREILAACQPTVECFNIQRKSDTSSVIASWAGSASVHRFGQIYLADISILRRDNGKK